MSRAWNYLENFLPSLGNKEEEFRDFYLGSTLSMNLIISVFIILANMAMIYTDIFFAKGNLELFRNSVAVRILFAMFTIVAAIYVLRNKKYNHVENTAVLWVICASLCFLYFNYTRPANHLTTSVDMLFIFGVYVFFGYRLRYLFPIMIVFSSASVWITFSQKSDIPNITHNLTLAVHILAQTIGLLAALQIRSFRRKAFLAYIKERETSELAIRLSQIDALTDCFTRRHFLHLAEQELLRAKRYRHPLCVIMMDLDRFKSINDRYGHLAGDQVLKAFAKMLMNQKRQSDVLGRLGGEEFALLLPETNIENAEIVAERIREIWENLDIPISGLIINSTVSVGVTELGDPGQDFEELLHNADLLMYKAKTNHHERSGREPKAATAA